MANPEAQSPAESSYPFAATAEAILGVPLHLGMVAVPDIPEGRRDIREFAYQFVLDALTHQLGAPPTDAETLASERLQTVAELEDIRYLAGQVVIANSIYASMAEPSASLADAVEARIRLQARITGKLSTHSQTVPEQLAYDPKTPLRENFDDDGYAVIAPTGGGKTVVEAELLNRSGVGKSSPDGTPTRAVVVTSTRKLVRQFIGLVGDDTFRRFLGEDASVTAVYTDVNNPSGDVVVTTPNSVHKLDLSEFKKLIVDEGHSGLAPRMHKLLGKAGIRPYLFTATPVLNDKRDLRTLYDSYEIGTLRSWIEDGALSPMRLLTFEYDKNPEIMAARLAHDYFQKDRRVAVFARPGGGSKQSQLVAAGVNELAGELVARSVGKHESQSEAYEQDFAQGTLPVLTTCNRLGEGWNENVDVVILIGPNYSMKLVKQKMGRASRFGRFLSEVAEIVPRNRTGRKMASIWGAMGLEKISDDVVIATGGVQPMEEYIAQQKQRPPSERMLPAFFDAEAFSRELRGSVVINRPLRSIIMGASRFGGEYTPSGHTDLHTLAGRYKVPALWLQYKLTQATISYVGVVDSSQHEGYLRWYNDEEFQAYVKKTPLPELAEPGVLNCASIAAICGITESQAGSIMSALDAKPVSRLSPNAHMGQTRHRETPHYRFEDVLLAYAVAESLPMATPTDVTLISMREICGRSFLYRVLDDPEHAINPFPRQRNPMHGLTGSCLHITLEDSQKVLALYEKFKKVPPLDDTMKTFQMIATAADVTLATLRQRMTDSEKAAIADRRIRGKKARCLPNAVANVIIERLKAKPVPPHLIPSMMYEQRVRQIEYRLFKWRRAHKENTDQRLRVIGRGPRALLCLTWRQLASVEADYGTVPNAATIDFDKVVRGPDDRDPKRIAYSQRIQKLYIPGDAILSYEEALKPPQPTSSPAPVVDRSQPSATQVDDVQVRTPPSAHKATKTPQDSKAIASPAPNPVRPTGYINITQYLKDVGAPCESRLIRRLAQRQQLEKPITDEQSGDLWGSEETALLLEDTIKATFPLAEAGMATPQQIAVTFADLGLNEQHVAYVAPQLTTDLSDYVTIRRSVTAEGQPGELAFHYTAFMTKCVKEQIALLRDTGRIGALLGFGNIKTPPPLKKRG